MSRPCIRLARVKYALVVLGLSAAAFGSQRAPISQQLTFSPYRATGIYAFNDELALVALEVLRDRRVSLPDAVALIGCDDSPAADRVRPRLSTLRFDAHGRWREIAGHLHAMISGDGRYPRATVSEPAIVPGDTT